MIDDTWLKLSQLMWIKDRKQSRTQRANDYAARNANEWSVRAMQDILKRK